MIPLWVIHITTVGTLAVGFGLGWVWRGWHEHVNAVEALKKLGIDPEDLK